MHVRKNLHENALCWQSRRYSWNRTSKLPGMLCESISVSSTSKHRKFLSLRVCHASNAAGIEFAECETSQRNCYLAETPMQRAKDDDIEVNERVCTDATASKNIILPPLEVRYHEIGEHRLDCASITVSHVLEYDNSLSKFASQIGYKRR